MPVDTNISTPQNSGLKVNIDNSRAVTATQNDFGTVLGNGLNRTMNAALTASSVASAYVPGGAVLSAAITGVGAMRSSVTGQASGVNATGVTGLSGTSITGTSAASTTTTSSSVDSLAASGDTSAILLQQTQKMQEMNQSFNLQYLQLQENMQADNRQFTTLSNVMKTKQDTAKNAINNLR